VSSFFRFRLQVPPYDEGEDSGGGNLLLTSRAGGQGWSTRPIASFVGYGVGREWVVLVFVRGWEVEGDLAPIGGTCVREEVVYFFGGA